MNKTMTVTYWPIYECYLCPTTRLSRLAMLSCTFNKHKCRFTFISVRSSAHILCKLALPNVARQNVYSLGHVHVHCSVSLCLCLCLCLCLSVSLSLCMFPVCLYICMFLFQMFRGMCAPECGCQRKTLDTVPQNHLLLPGTQSLTGLELIKWTTLNV